MFSIYIIKNTINNKVYIGQTSKPLKERFRYHCYNYNQCKKISRAINKYGKENFRIELLEMVSSRIEADKKERYWINYYNSVLGGYNIEYGGNSAYHTKKVLCLTDNIIFETVGDACKYYNCENSNYIYRVCRGERRSYKGKIFVYLDPSNKQILNNIDFSRKPSRIKTICIETGEIYNSAKDASINMGLSRNAVSLCCRGIVTGKQIGRAHV